jgi:hypothetical protein
MTKPLSHAFSGMTPFNSDEVDKAIALLENLMRKRAVKLAARAPSAYRSLRSPHPTPSLEIPRHSAPHR